MTSPIFSITCTLETQQAKNLNNSWGAAHPASSFDPKQQESLHWANIAASAQLRLEEALLHLAQHATKETGSRNLCLAGGVALNLKGKPKTRRIGYLRQYLHSAGGWRCRRSLLEQRCGAIISSKKNHSTPSISHQSWCILLHIRDKISS